MFGVVAAVYKKKRPAKSKLKSGRVIEGKHIENQVRIVGRRDIETFRNEIRFGLERKNTVLDTLNLPTNTREFIPTFEGRIKDQYHTDIDFNRFVRKNADTVRKAVNGWTNVRWLSRQHFEILESRLSDDLYIDWKEAEKYKFVPIIDILEEEAEETFDFEVDEIHRYSLEGVVSHNSGAYVENPIDQVKWTARETKRYNAADGCKPLSFNVNHYSDFRELLYELKLPVPKGKFHQHENGRTRQGH